MISSTLQLLGQSKTFTWFLIKLLLAPKHLNYKIEKNKFLNLLESIRHRFASFDTLVQLTPISFINLCRWLLVSVLIYSCYVYTNGINNLALFGGGTWLAKLLNSLFGTRINVEASVAALFIGMIVSIWLRLLYRIGSYFSNIWLAVYLFVIEESRIKKIKLWKKILYCFTWPIFDIIGRYTTYIALFVKVTWKPIPHVSKVTIDEVDTSKGE